MIVDGAAEFTGSNLGTAAKAIMESAKIPKAKIEISKNGEKFDIKISEIPQHSEATVYFVIAEDNLSSNVKRGENSGKTLEHTSVVRRIETDWKN